eukprot:3847660-Rhodomonas_salina.1
MCIRDRGRAGQMAGVRGEGREDQWDEGARDEGQAERVHVPSAPSLLYTERHRDSHLRRWRFA